MNFIDEYKSVEDYLDGPVNDIEDFIDTSRLIVTNQNKLEELNEFPLFESRKRYITRKFGNMYNLNKFDHKGMEYDYKIEKLAKGIIIKNIGKTYDLAFSYFCKKVSKDKQHIFEYFFEQDKIQDYYKNIYYGYYVDDNRLIQENKYKK
jgi:hypothetical protein